MKEMDKYAEKHIHHSIRENSKRIEANLDVHQQGLEEAKGWIQCSPRQ